MDYFQAVQVGRQRVQTAVNFLQSVAGPSYPMLFLKLGLGDWTPVGEEMLYAVVEGKKGMTAVVICDEGGNAKAMSSMLPEQRALEVSNSLAKSMKKFEGEVKLPL